MYCTLIIARYPRLLGVFGFFSMMIFRFPLSLNKQIKFWKLMGSGKNGTFDIQPDFNQWAILFTSENHHASLPVFIKKYFSFFKCDVKEIKLQPVEGFGLWDKKEVFGKLPRQTNFDGPIAVLTRATINISRLKNFWQNVEAAASKMLSAEGFILSYGIGEVPWIKQATFSIWKDKNSMKNYAYKTLQHADVIKKTRKENWYKEEMFIRFKIISMKGFDENIQTKIFNLQPSYDEA